MSKRSVLLQLAAHPTRYQIVSHSKTINRLVSRGMAVRKDFKGNARYKITGSGIRKARMLADNIEGNHATKGP